VRERIGGIAYGGVRIRDRREHEPKRRDSKRADRPGQRNDYSKRADKPGGAATTAKREVKAFGAKNLTISDRL